MKAFDIECQYVDLAHSLGPYAVFSGLPGLLSLSWLATTK